MWELVDGTIEVFRGSGITQIVVFELPYIQNKDIDTGYTFGQVVWLEKYDVQTCKIPSQWDLTN